MSGSDPWMPSGLFVRSWHGYLNTTMKTDISWRALGILSNATWEDQYRADPLVTSTVVDWGPTRKAFSELSMKSFDAMRDSLKKKYTQAFHLHSRVPEDSALDRSVLAFGLSFTQRFTDDRFVSLWRVLETMTLEKSDSRGSQVDRVYAMLSKIGVVVTRTQIEKWWRLRSRILHEGTTEESYLKCKTEIDTIFDCAEQLLNVIPELRPDHRR